MSETQTYPVKARIASAAHIDSMEAYEAMYQRSIDDPQGFWLEQTRRRLDWFVEPTDGGAWDYSETLDVRWFEGGKLNAAFNCVDRHAAIDPERTAIIWAKDEVGEYEHISYGKLKREVGRVANVLKHHGVGKGDRVCIYMPMIPELAYTTLACARIGAVHSIVFAGFSAAALRGRIEDCRSAVVVCADEGMRGGRTVPLKQTTDEALAGLDWVHTVLVARRTGADVPMTAGRDYWLADEMNNQRPTCPAEWMDAEDPLFILYTSGSTGRPKGLLHTTGGYLTYASMTHEYVFDIHENDVYACVADVGWITGHSYILYGPLCNGATTVMFESTPLYPDAGRYWKMVEDLKVTVFYTAPTAIRAVAREGDEWVTKYDRSSIRVLGTVGEPINPEVWVWYHDVVGEGRCAIVDTWWQTETGGIMITPLPGATPTKPGSATRPFFGIRPLLVDDAGEVLEGAAEGNLCIAGSWPGQSRTIYNDHGRYREVYYSRFPGRYFTGDGCRRDADGDYWITGRVDDVINVSGHRLGTAEIESALVALDSVAEAAVIGTPHEIKGEGIYCYVILTPGNDDHDALREQMIAAVRTEIGPFAKPDAIQFAPGLPKTRSGKIMRRILRKIAVDAYEDLGDVSTLADPGVVEALISGRKALKG